MPPRKSAGSTGEGDEIVTAEDVSKGNKSAGKQPEPDTGANVEDYLLPRSLTQRLAKGVLPPNTAINKDALLAISKAATVFVSYLSSHANEETQKKTIAPQDVLAALSEIEFDSFRPRLEQELEAYTENAAQKRKGKKDGKSDAKGTNEPVNNAGDSEPETKKVKRSSGQEDDEIAAGKSKQSPSTTPGGKDDAQAGAETVAQPVDDDETEELEEEDHGEEEDEEEEEEEQDEEREEEEQEDATQLEEELEEAADSDTVKRRRNPDLDPDTESDSDGF